jgi:SAM-dependent methyltransferase
VARYDGIADWYDEMIHGAGAPVTNQVEDLVRGLLGRGSGSCVDVACGGGVFVPVLRELGWDVTGVDVSEDQLRVARDRVGSQATLLQADAAALPFADASFDAAVCLLAHSDVDAYEDVLGELARVLRPGATLVHVGTHPCFVGPFAVPRADEPPLLDRGYHETDRAEGAVGHQPGGLRIKVGERHLPLARLLNAALDAGFALQHVVESKEDPPILLAFGAERAGG